MTQPHARDPIEKQKPSLANSFNTNNLFTVGNEGISDDEGRAHFALWALGKSPLLIGCDVTQMSDTTKATLLADEIIAINQVAHTLDTLIRTYLHCHCLHSS